MALIKLRIDSYGKADYISSHKGTINAFINPESYAVTNSNNFSSFNIKGDSEQTFFFNNTGGSVLKIDKLLVDGTKIVQSAGFKDVDAYLKDLSKLVYEYNGEIHMPPYVKVTWGNFVFKGVCTSYNVKYTLFKPDGTCLRAEVSMEFKASVDPQTKVNKAANSSPDLTHARTVKAGDTLPLMTYRIYGTSAYYMEVARINNLSNINAIKPGDQIYFPPLKK
ncbi:LysM repeat protein [Pedobacter cryoconitis]|uniref:LysM repeat protein n=1 Tax=Pedobacter cryoconitis TaxID=188932 RepID=A0A7W8ZMR4_9SPHI|nr:LysM peptidoglycan-binding domain-containing protein [Pedobacter cryoconitis]MBB5636869.1 LysM repeat protein [Pedobacter cryoconitis]MBB6271268.1 LysM repeat protein [Pedobacter cryoconitis]